MNRSGDLNLCTGGNNTLTTLLYFIGGTALFASSLFLLLKLYRRLQLSFAKHPTLQGHSKMLRMSSKWVPRYNIKGEQFFGCDGAPIEISKIRRGAFFKLAEELRVQNPHSSKLTKELENDISDLDFTKRYRVPYQFADFVNKHLAINTFVDKSKHTQVRDVDGNWSDDLGGSYGVNVFGYDFYKDCMEEAQRAAGNMGPVLGPYHPLIARNVSRLKKISGLDEVSFHMSGTEAVMQAVRLARYHTNKRRLVQFCGAYHGWWDGVQPGLGNNRKVQDVYTLSEDSDATLRVLRQRDDIACVLVNPLQALHPNRNAPSDSTLLLARKGFSFDKARYTNWLRRLREVCFDKGIILIFDEVFVGFRLAKGGAQEFFGVKADLVTYGKTLGGGYPVGVVCGRADLMRRYKQDQPTNICFARGTFNSHPYVMASMDAFLNRLDCNEMDLNYQNLETQWNSRAEYLNARLIEENLPIRVVNMLSIWTIIFPRAGRYHWLLQYYLKSEGITLGWVGTGKLLFSHNFSDEDFKRIAAKIIRATRRMQEDNWFWAPSKGLGTLVAKEFTKALWRPQSNQ